MKKILFGFGMIFLLTLVLIPVHSAGSQAVPTDNGYPAPWQSTTPNWAYPAPPMATAIQPNPGCWYLNEPKLYATLTGPECTRTPSPSQVESKHSDHANLSPAPTAMPRVNWIRRASWSIFKLLAHLGGSPLTAP